MNISYMEKNYEILDDFSFFHKKPYKKNAAGSEL